MALTGQRFELDLDADNFTFNNVDGSGPNDSFSIKDVQEHESSEAPAPPAPRATKQGFPEHKQRKVVSRFRQAQQKSQSPTVAQRPPRQSDAALAHAVTRRDGVDITTDQKTEIGKENDRRIATMSEDEIREAQEEIMATLSPALVERLMKRRRDNTESVSTSEATTASAQDADNSTSKPQAPSLHADESAGNKPEEDDTAHKTAAQAQPASDASPDSNALSDTDATRPAQGLQPQTQSTSSVHFPMPPRPASDYRPLDPSSNTFLSDLKSTYFPELAHTPSPTSLTWLQPDIRFSFRGALIAPESSLNIPTHLGLHHHGEAPSSAGYTIPELTLLARSTLPNQRCVAYQTVGRILYRLGKEEFGPRGSELYEALWALIEQERVLEVIMAEANRKSGHVSAKAYATEALWLWRKGCGGERGLRREGERVAK
ncbi:RNA polymerase II-associated protein RBA50 [Cyphellophora attinorum]|uniref:RNA polymerase II-associated protein RBA50 n=1 Tax=Cyphellophora attinorum TaxID=1664694 RepID=A0A0N0NHP3_9EURO|nr:RNA polymerase II-associated protein RBA50 [Phialophora attinorum]KPI34798.1 RNA polymerase II-associated protein RBA50 [Phialophora attinorum]